MQGKNAALIRRYYPGYQSPKRAYETLLDRTVTTTTRWLDLGCGRRLTGNSELNRNLTQRARLVVGCDRDPHLKRHETIRDLVLCDAAALPFRDATFDLITASMVAEHLEKPQRVFAEVARVAAPGAHFIVFTPNKWNYAMVVARLTPHPFHVAYKRMTYFLNRGEWKSFEDDVFPTWYRANTISDLRKLAQQAGLREVRITRHGLAHSFGFVKPLYILSLLFERLIDRPVLETLKADILAVFEKPGLASSTAAKLGDEKESSTVGERQSYSLDARG
ncbi:MAG: hypothetical protein KatS3mg077_1088 [Candidatus Binatia bacterium]|nr:MAG: hypothetical protein KatS3mg077_1088 [Candidatus Binatia bacterium]